MSEYGYIPEAPEQSAFNNKGIFSPKDIYNLDRADKWTPQLGQLELIETQTVNDPTFASAIQYVDFTSLGDYSVHLLTFSNFQQQGYDYPALRFFENGVLETSAVYQYAYQDAISSGTFSEAKSTGDDFLRIGGYTWRNINGYAYLYNLSDSSKYSFTTFHLSMVEGNNLGNHMSFGSGVLPQASVVDGIRFTSEPTQLIKYLDISLYGIKEYS
jgi:hypothetical protein